MKDSIVADNNLIELRDWKNSFFLLIKPSFQCRHGRLKASSSHPVHENAIFINLNQASWNVIKSLKKLIEHSKASVRQNISEKSSASVTIRSQHCTFIHVGNHACGTKQKIEVKMQINWKLIFERRFVFTQSSEDGSCET